MSTLQELRATLDRHAHALDDTDRLARAGAVRRRVRVARRRRAVATVAAASVVVVGGAGALASFETPRRSDVVAPRVVGVEVPSQIAVLGFPYELADQEAVASTDDRLELGPSDEQRAVSLVGSGLGSGSATLSINGTAVARVFADQPVAVPVPVPASDSDDLLTVDVHDAPADARTGVAVYDATGELAPGVDNGTSVFRDVVGDARLLEADFSDPGSARAAIAFRAPGSTTTITGSCRTDEPGLVLEVVVDGDVTTRGSCVDTTGPDAFGSFSSTFGTADRDYTVVARVTRGNRGEVVPDAAAELAVAAYESGSKTRVAGADVADVVEFLGRTWRLDAGEVGDRLRIKAETDVLVGFVAAGGSVHATWRGDLMSGASAFADNRTGLPGTAVNDVLLAGDTYDLALVFEDGSAGVDGTLLVYRPE